MPAGRQLASGWAATLTMLALISGCASLSCPCDKTDVGLQLGERTGFSLGDSLGPGELIWPSGASPADGLTEDEAVLIALWNNAAFQERLTELGIAYGDLVDAGLLPNPEVEYLIPWGNKGYEYTFSLPLEAFWLRPIRVAAAELESQRVCDRLTQAALDLIRDVRQSYADLLLAQGRLAIGQEAVRLRERIAQLAQARVDAGEASPQEASVTKIDVLQAKQEVIRLTFDVAIAQEQLRNLLGMGVDRLQLTLAGEPPPRRTDLATEMLVAEAIGNRPDILAAEAALAAADERVRLAKLSWFQVAGLVDGNGGPNASHLAGPGLNVTLPLFHMNQGAIIRAEAELDRAVRQKQTLHDRVILEIYQAHQRYARARAELAILDGQVRPEVDASIERTERAYRVGDVSYAVVQEAARQWVDSRLRREELLADLRRAWAELQRSVGRRLDDPLAAGIMEPLPAARMINPLK